MGLIRKTLSFGTLGLVDGSSKKQRVARETLETIRGPRGPLGARFVAELRGSKWHVIDTTNGRSVARFGRLAAAEWQRDRLNRRG